MSGRIAMKWSSTVLAFRLLYVAFIVVASATTLMSAWTEMYASGGHSAPNPSLLVVLAAVEIAAAISFSFRRIEIPAGIALLIVYAVAEVLSIHHQEVTLRFIFYAGTVLFILAAARRE